LISRIKALLKRAEKNRENDDATGKKASKENHLLVDKDRFIVLKDEEELFLPKKEFELLSLLLSKPGKVFTREDIFEKVWGNDVVVGDRTIDVHIRKLREKIGDHHIKTIKGVGYKYIP